MTPLLVKPVETRRERKLFLEFPWRHYVGDPNWIPPLRMNQRELVGYAHHPFYDAAECQTFLAVRDGQVCGRVAAILNHAHNRRHKEQRGFFGFFESVDDPQVAAGLLGAVRQWFEKRGIRAVRGPVNPSMNYECGLLVEGFHEPPMFMLTYNPPYYAALIEGCGFQKAQDMYAYGGDRSMLPTMDKKLAFIGQEAKRRFNVTMRPMNRRRFRQEVNLFLELYNTALAHMWGFVPLSDAEIKHLGLVMKFLIVPRLSCIAEVEGRPIAAFFYLLDYNPLIKRIDGRLFPFGFLRLLLGRRRIKRLRVVAATVIPEYQRWGIAITVLQHMLPIGLAWGLNEVEFSWVLESNTLSRRSLERAGAVRTKTYRIYDLDETAG